MIIFRLWLHVLVFVVVWCSVGHGSILAVFICDLKGFGVRWSIEAHQLLTLNLPLSFPTLPPNPPTFPSLPHPFSPLKKNEL